MKINLDDTVNKIYLLVYSYKLSDNHCTSYLTEKRAHEHMQYVIDHGAINAFVKEINLWME